MPARGNASFPPVKSVFTGPVYVVRDNIDTDQIIPAQYLNLVPTIAEEYEKLGSFAMCGLPDALYPTRFIQPGALHGEAMTISWGFSASACLTAGMTSSRSGASEKCFSAGSVWPGGS